MSKAAQLKRKAAEFEQKRQYDRALNSYVQAIDAAAGIPDELDIPLYNRVGDLYLRLGQLDQAVSYYETAVDLYAEGGFFNNAIALCNKVLRHAPDRTGIFYKLGKISARKGFNSDAKQNFLEYAARMERAGDVSEAFRALKEFADLCPGQDDVRLMLAEQLIRAGRTGEALEQLQTVYNTMIADDRRSEAVATLERIRALDPTYEPSTGRSQREQKREGLVFIEVDYPAGSGGGSAAARGTEAHPLTAEKFGAVELPEPADVRGRKTLDESPLAGLTPLEDPLTALAADAASDAPANEPAQPLPGLEYTVLSDPVPGAESPAAAPEGEEELSTYPDNAAAPSTGPDADIFSGSFTGYVETLSSEVGSIEGGLPDDLAVLPLEALDDEQSAALQAPRPDDEDFMDLAEWLRESEKPMNPRMTGEEEQQEEGTVQTDFSQMLETFKRGVDENVDDADLDSHYDLGVAYMEMGLLDEAIAQFQKSMRGDATPEHRVRAYESLGQSFIEKGECEVAIESLRGGLNEPGLTDGKLIGVLYLLGYASEKLARWRDAEGYYRRVFASDINFRDIGERLRRAEQVQ